MVPTWALPVIYWIAVHRMPVNAMRSLGTDTIRNKSPYGIAVVPLRNSAAAGEHV